MRWTGRLCFSAILVVVLAVVGHAQNIFEAVSSGNADQVRDLITADSSLINSTTAQGMTPLRMAVQTGNLAITELLLEMAARADDIHPVFGSVMNQAFFASCQRKDGPELVELLMRHGLAFNAEPINALGMSPLDMAVRFGNLPMTLFALEHGADVNAASQPLGRTALITAVSKGRDDLVGMLLEHGADVSIVDSEGNPPIFYAVVQGKASTVGKLLAHGATTDFIEPHNGQGLLHLAAIRGFCDIADSLVAHGASINAADKLGNTPVLYAAKYGNRSFENYLIAKGAARPASLIEHDIKSPRPERNIDPNQATAWYLNHRGWAVQTKSDLLVFDAEEFDVRRSDNPCLANGFLTAAELEPHNVMALYSCYHGGPGEPAYIHTLADSLDHIAFVHLVDDAWRGSPNTTYLKSQADTTVGDIALRTIDIMESMPTLAYLIKVDELCIFYQAFGSDNLEKLQQDYEALATSADTIDIAFLPLPESGSEEESDLRLFLDRFPTRAVCLLDPNRREYLFPRVARIVADWGFSTNVFCAENPGDHFEYHGSKK